MTAADAAARAALARAIRQGQGAEPADLVIKGADILNVFTLEVMPGDVAIAGDRIVGIHDDYEGREILDGTGLTVVPGFIDTHCHVESSLITPGEFDRGVLPRGTTTAICDPHEIANVLGLEGIRYFLAAAEALVMDLRIQLSSCVPATHLETAGADLPAEVLLPFARHPKVIGLAEMMNVPGVLAAAEPVLDKLIAFQDGHIDGHAPLVTGKALNGYLTARIRTDHECTRLDEAREKLRKGMYVLMREGSVAKDVAALTPLLSEVTSPFIAFCTDDRNPLEIAREGHLDHAIRKAIGLGAPVAASYRAASLSAARAFGLTDRGAVAPGYLADLVLVSDLAGCRVERVIKSGRVVTDASFADRDLPAPIGLTSVKREPATAEVFRIGANASRTPVIGVIEHSLLTEPLEDEVPLRDGARVADPARDLLKVCVLERHGVNGNTGRGFVRGFALNEGAIASSVGHDSHNLCVIGVNDADMAVAVNRLIDLQGGFVVVRDGAVLAELALPLAGLMSLEPLETVEAALVELRAAAHAIGCTLAEPFLQLAFLPLPVIPHLKITDKGMVDVDRFELIV